MADTRKAIECSYCGASYSLKWNEDDLNPPEFCCWCAEPMAGPVVEDDEEDEEDIEYETDENELN